MEIFMPGPCPITRETPDLSRIHRLIPAGYYDTNEVVDLLRKHKHDPEVVGYIADMLEE